MKWPHHSRWHYLAALTILFALFFFRLGRADVVGDSATYLYRSVGYVDYMSSKLQTTPIQWFTTLPGWAHFGFHDAPPLGFAIMHLGFKLFHSVVGVRALAALFGVIIGFVIWKMVCERAGAAPAFLWLAVFASLTPLIIIQRTTLLESFQLVWLTLGFYFFFKTENAPHWWYATAACFAAAFLTKYTAAFILLGPAVWLIVHPKLLKLRPVYLSCVLFVVLISPILIYNLAMWRAVGHPDLQFSTFLKLNTAEHWPGIQRAISHTPLQNISAAFLKLFFPSVWLIILSAIGWNLWTTIKIRAVRSTVLLISSAGSIVGIALIGSAYWYAAGFILVCALLCAEAAPIIFKLEPKYKMAVLIIIILSGCGGLAATAKNAYAINEPTGLFSLQSREPNRGWNELDAVLQNFLSARTPKALANPWGFYTENTALREEFKRVQQPNGSTNYSGIIIYDGRIPWFQRLWYFERWNFYHQFLIFSTKEYQTLNQEPPGFPALGFNPAEYSLIIALQPTITENVEADESTSRFAASAEAAFQKINAPTKIIFGPDGVARFKIYGALAR